MDLLYPKAIAVFALQTITLWRGFVFSGTLLMENNADFSVVRFRSDCVLFSEKNYVKALKNQWVLAMPYPSERLAGATRRGHTTAPEVQTPSQ
jgi:hypothetical protein